jgi:hypothetical protein
LKANVALSITFPAMAPVTPPLPSSSVPPLIVVLPEYKLLPVRTSVPEPIFVMEMSPAPIGPITPLNVVEVLSMPTVKVTGAVVALLITEPLPASEPIVLLNPFRSRVAPASTVNRDDGVAGRSPA